MRYLFIDRGTGVVKDGSLKVSDLQRLVDGPIGNGLCAESADRQAYELAGYDRVNGERLP